MTGYLLGDDSTMEQARGKQMAGLEKHHSTTAGTRWSSESTGDADHRCRNARACGTRLRTSEPRCLTVLRALPRGLPHRSVAFILGGGTP